jgi:hypothetical protein
MSMCQRHFPTVFSKIDQHDHMFIFIKVSLVLQIAFFLYLGAGNLSPNDGSYPYQPLKHCGMLKIIARTITIQCESIILTKAYRSRHLLPPYSVCDFSDAQSLEYRINPPNHAALKTKLAVHNSPAITVNGLPAHTTTAPFWPRRLHIL